MWGTLEPMNSKKNATLVLNFCEACNKILHCLSINFDYISENPKRGMALNPFVHLYGSKGEQEWKATIDINRFVELAA